MAAATFFYSSGERKLGKGMGMTVTIAVHALLLLLLLPGKPGTPPHEMVLSARIVSESPQQEVLHEPTLQQPQLQAPKLTLPLPEITVSHEPAPSKIKASVARSEPKPSETAPAPQQSYSEPRFDADYLNNPQPVYPRVSRRLRETGIVTLRVFVGPDGLPKTVELEKSSGFPRLDESALSAVQLWKFAPAQRAGVSVGAWVLVPVEFSLNT